MHTRCRRPTSRSRGFTLLELMIALVITAILVAVALPSFMSSIRKGRRSEAMTALTALQQEQERWRSNNQTYTTSLTNLRINSATTAPGGYYSLSVSSATDTGYTAVADGTGSGQAADGNCNKMAVQVDRGNITYADANLSFAASNPCWAR